jgi:hypothetical protein
MSRRGKSFCHKKAQATQEGLRRLAGKVLLFSVSVKIRAIRGYFSALVAASPRCVS